MMSKQVFSTEVIGGVGSADVAVTVCTAQVDLDLETEGAARRELSRPAAGTGPIVIDVSGVFVAVAGLRLLLAHVQDLRRAGRRAELVVNHHLHRVAHMVGQPRDMLWLTLPDALARARTPVPDAARSDGSSGRRPVRSVPQFGADGHG